MQEERRTFYRLVFFRFPRICFLLGLPSNVGVQEERRTFYRSFSFDFQGFVSLWGSPQMWACRRSAAHFSNDLLFPFSRNSFLLGLLRMWACRRRAAHLADVSRHPLTDGIRVVCKRFTSGVEAVEVRLNRGVRREIGATKRNLV